MAKIIMVQGTSSGVGKSIFSTALCRIFTQDGYNVAPFKVQNMSSNIHILNDGKKIARSQAICAYACNIKPDYRMNPILLLPSNNNTEVYLNGEYKGNMDRFSYEDIKGDFFNQAIISFNSLCDEHDIVVIEGAGSPVELNLIKSDIVNMGFAKKVNSPVILLSDISRGGIFAFLYGTINLMSKDEQNLVKGVVINKFKGDAKYFKDGVSIIEDICKKDVLGVLPYFDINIEDEDSLVDNGIMKTKELLLSRLHNKTEENYISYLNKEFDLLATNFRENLNMQKIYNILN
ncbi:cobyric acid synthase [uncultured Tyzzerella sp.]|uniref:cobyric acid synthase n=1 Tax=uncultured Tyzzerella sp. TaxID=2321398 RepID=UPI00294380C2|nr:cobyric acid synthase [uncultured Tyzzerella sp.]